MQQFTRKQRVKVVIQSLQKFNMSSITVLAIYLDAHLAQGPS